MIARLSSCDDGLLRQLLHGQLANDTEHAVAEHLSECADCQIRLETLTLADEAWQDTKEAMVAGKQDLGDDFDLGPATSVLDGQTQNLSGSHDLPSRQTALPDETTGTTAEARAAEHWVRKHLQPVDDSRFIGSLDSIPIRSVVGQGGMGVVLRAHDASLHRELAIKLLSPMLASNGTSRQRFFREAQAAAAVVHPNIVPIYAVAEDNELPYLSMPYVSGGNLQQLIQRDGQQELARVLSIGLQVAEGLSAAHAQGIVHRDIKPANLMLDGGGFRVMLTDFGLARALDDTTLTCSGMISGTPQYMSPEQAAGRSVDHRSDIYSLGAVLYALATGRPPVGGESSMEVLRRVGESRPTPVVELNESYPVWFDSLLAKLMARNTGDRIQSANECCALLREVLAHVRSPSRVALPAELVPPASFRRTDFILWPLGAIAFTLFGFAISGGLSPDFDGNTNDSRKSGKQSSGPVNPDSPSESGDVQGPRKTGQDTSPTAPQWGQVAVPAADQVDLMLYEIEAELKMLDSNLTP